MTDNSNFNNQVDPMTVEQFFKTEKLNLEFLEKVRNKYATSYWDTSYSFVAKVWSKQLYTLTARQISWVERIVEDCTELRIERKIK